MRLPLSTVHGEIWGAKKGLLCNGCELDFSYARGASGSGEGAEKIETEAPWFPCQPRRKGLPGALGGGSQGEKLPCTLMLLWRDSSMHYGTGNAIQSGQSIGVRECGVGSSWV